MQKGTIIVFTAPLMFFKNSNYFKGMVQLSPPGWATPGKVRMSNNMAKIADARKTVEQLKLEVNIERMLVDRKSVV